MVINGVDYSIYIVAIAVFAVVALAEFFICLKAKNPSARKLLLFLPFFILVVGLVIYGGESGGGFLDLRGVVLILAAGLAVVCALGMFAGWLVFKLKFEKASEMPESCPYSEQISENSEE